MKKLLIVTYVFPPMAAVGGQRLVNFCKFLPEYGWEPVVLTVDGGSNAAWDASPLADIPNVKIYRARTFEPLQKWEARHHESKPVAQRSADAPPSAPSTPAAAQPSVMSSLKRYVRLALSVPDHAIFWVPLAYFPGRKVIKGEKIDAVFSSSPPVSSHLLASALAKSAGLPHIVDFRDLWTLNHAYPLRRYPDSFVRYDRFWERRVLSRAAHVTTASPGFSDQMKSHLNGMLADRVTTITNGFDYREVDLGKNYNTAPGEPMRFLYAGSLYGEFNPIFFLETLSGWLNADRIDPSTIQVDFYGNCDRDYSILVQQLGLAGRVQFHGFKSRKELLPLFPQADCLVLLLGFSEQYATVIPAKVFDYLAAGTQILALAPDGVSTGLIRKYEAGTAIHVPDKEGMIAKFRLLYQTWQTTRERKRAFRHIPEIDRRHLTGELARLLDKVTANHR